MQRNFIKILKIACPIKSVTIFLDRMINYQEKVSKGPGAMGL